MIIESFICKTPVIVSNYPGVEDILNHEKNGIVVQKGNKNELTSSMEKLIKDKTYGEKLANNGYKSAFEFTTSISKYEQLINELL